LIYIERTITINESSAFIEAPIVLYKGDRNIEIQFSIKNSPFKHKAGIDLTYGQLVIKRPKTNPIFSEVAKISSGKVLFTITDDMIDEFTELGDYDFQIRLLNSDLSSRATLPPVSAGIRVIEPLCEESVNSAPVNYSRAVIDREVEGTFDEEGNYNKTDWSNGDIITDSKLNKIEDALYTVNDSKATKDDIPTDVSAFTNDAGYLTEHQSLEAYALKADIPSTDGLATEQYINELIGGLDVSYFPNSIGYVTKQYVDDAVANVDVDLTGYATEAYVQDAISNLEIPEGEGGGNVDLTGYATEQFVNDAISNMPKEIPIVSENISDILSFESSFAPEGFCYFSNFSVSHVHHMTGDSMGTIYLQNGLYYGRTYPHLVPGRYPVETIMVDLYSYETHKTYRFTEYVDQEFSIRTGRIVLESEGQSDFVTQSDLSNYATKEELQTTLGDIESLLGKI
jgi:hypothetical protein